MNYSNMAMVWAEIMLHMDVDQCTIYEKNVDILNRTLQMIPTNWLGPSDCWLQWSNQQSNNIGYGAPTFNGPYKRPSCAYNYNPYHTIGNNPLPAFAMAREGPNHGYDYNPYNIVGSVPLPTFAVAHEWPSHYYDHNPYRSITNIPPPTFGPQSTTRNKDEEECQRQLEEATIHSQKDYIQKLEEITAYLIYNGTCFISSTLDYHLVWAGTTANLITTTMTQTD